MTGYFPIDVSGELLYTYWLEVYIYIPKNVQHSGCLRLIICKLELCVYISIDLIQHLTRLVHSRASDLSFGQRPNDDCHGVNRQADINDSPRLPSDWSPLEYELLECHLDGWVVVMGHEKLPVLPWVFPCISNETCIFTYT